MAILANRIKTVNILSDFIDSLKAFVVRFLSIILMCSSIFLWSFAGNSKITMMVFDSTAFMINPILSVFDAASMYIIDTKKSINNLWNTSQENISLKLENAKLQSLLMDTASLKAENENLKIQLKFSKENIDNITISARVISVFNGIYARGGIINLGNKNNIEKHQIVISNGSVVGKIIYTASNYSKIMFITDSNSRIPVISSITGEKAIFAGDGHDGGSLLYMANGHKIKPGEYLLSSGDGKYYPYGLPIAKVITVNGSYVYAESLVNLNNVQFVSILAPINNN
jgi:rod shape-determining protein MreC